jgi:hypothetical protein
MATKLTRQHWLSLTSRSVWAALVSGLLLFVPMFGRAGTLLAWTNARLSTHTESESGPEDTGEDDAPAAHMADVGQSRKTMAGFRTTSSSATFDLLNADALLQNRQLISALPGGAFAVLIGAGIYMRC